MPKGGPKPVPTSLKLVNGTRKSRINLREPSSRTFERTPRPPEWMSDEGCRFWRSLASDLRRSGRLSADNVGTFAVLCEAFGRHERAAKMLNDPELDWFEGGKRHPALLEVREAAATALRYSQEFGLTPSARSAIKVPPPADDAEAAALLS